MIVVLEFMICAMLLDLRLPHILKFTIINIVVCLFFFCSCCCEMKEIANEQKEGRRELKKASVKKRVNIFFLHGYG